jgi:hypothetical protein
LLSAEINFGFMIFTKRKKKIRSVHTGILLRYPNPCGVKLFLPFFCQVVSKDNGNKKKKKLKIETRKDWNLSQ